jgi:hypothetical protein
LIKYTHIINIVFAPINCGVILFIKPFLQRSSVDAATGKLMMLPTDLVLLEDKKFAEWVAVYGKDGAKFNSDFTRAFQKLEELGTSGLIQTEWA